MRYDERSAMSFFNERVRAYDRSYDLPGSDGFALRARMKVVLGLAGRGPGEAFDAGMGPGRLLGELAARGWTVSGVDASEEMVAVARERLPDAQARLLRSEIESLPFADARFDVVLSTGALEYTNLGAALGELSRVLRPGGLAVVTYVNRHAAYALWKTRVFYPVIEVTKRLAGQAPRVRPRGLGLVTAARFRALLTTAGLEPEATVYTSFLAVPSPLDTLLPGFVERLGQRLEGRSSHATNWLSTQIVFSARKHQSSSR